MTPLQIIFIIVAAGILGAALMVVTTRNLIHAALWLILTLFGVAILFVILNATFLAVVQVIVYIGAIAILMIFAVMLTRRMFQDKGQQVNRNWWIAAIISAVMMIVLMYALTSWSDMASALPVSEISNDSVRDLGIALVSPNAFVIPFEVASILLLAALIGAIMIAWEKK